MTQLARYWNCDGQPRFYHHTGAVSNYYGLREALSEYAAEGSHQVSVNRYGHNVEYCKSFMSFHRIRFDKKDSSFKKKKTCYWTF